MKYKCLFRTLKSIHDYSWIILFVVSVFVFCFLCYNKSLINNEMPNVVALNILCSIFAAGLFHFGMVYLPYRCKKKTVEKLIIKDFIRLRECARLCRLTIKPTFTFDETKWNSKDEYAEHFCKTNLYDTWAIFKECSFTRLDRIERLRKDMKDIIDHLLFYQEYLNYSQFATLLKILECPLFSTQITPIDYNLTESERINQDNNQKQIGEAIYNICELLKQI